MLSPVQKNENSAAFTLIELLIVVAIIAILAAIAVPNFLEAQTRAKISRVKADMRTHAIAIEAYAVDYSKYVPNFHLFAGPVSETDALSKLPPAETNASVYDYIDICGQVLTTPVAYLTSIPHPSPFALQIPYFKDRGFFYEANMASATTTEPYGDWYGFDPLWGNQNTRFWLMDGGPDQTWFNTSANYSDVKAPYDPTNGTASKGNLWWLQGGKN